MSKGKHTEAQIIAALKQVEAGRTTEDVARELGVSKYTIYAWRSKYGGMDVSEAQEVKQLREENARLKKLVADLSLDKDMLESVIRKKLPGLVERRAEVRRLIGEFDTSERRVCGLVEIPRSELPVSEPARRYSAARTLVGAGA
jgi:putative transposase